MVCRYCCEDDLSAPQWLHSRSPFLSGEAGDNVSTCVRQDGDTPRAGLPRLLCRRAEQWAGGARRVSGQGEVVCTDPSFVHCRAGAGAGQPVNTCQSVKHKCNGHCFKGTFETIAIAIMYLALRGRTQIA